MKIRWIEFIPIPLILEIQKKPFMKDFVNIDKGEQSGVHWTCFNKKDNKSFYFDGFGGSLDLFLFKQLSKPITFNKY